MADTPEILKRARLPKSLRVMALVPNAKGLERALEAGVREVAWVISVSESHNRANVHRTVDESFRDFAAAWQGLGNDRPRLRLGLSTCFDCPFEGRITEDAVLRAVERVIEAAPEVEIGICDTTGRAATDHVGSLLASVMPRFASERRDASPITATTPTGWASPMPSRPIGRACACSTVRPAGSAAVRSRRARPATRRARTWCSPSSTWASKTGVDLARLLKVADRWRRVAPEQAGGKVRIVPRKRALAGYGAATHGVGA